MEGRQKGLPATAAVCGIVTTVFPFVALHSAGDPDTEGTCGPPGPGALERDVVHLCAWGT